MVMEDKMSKRDKLAVYNKYYNVKGDLLTLRDARDIIKARNKKKFGKAFYPFELEEEIQALSSHLSKLNKKLDRGVILW